MHSGRAAFLLDGARLRYRCEAAVKGWGRSWGGGGQWGTHKVLASTNIPLHFAGALLALENDGDFLGRLGLFVEDGLGLAAKALLLPVISPLTLRHKRVLALLVLGDLVLHVLVALATMRSNLRHTWVSKKVQYKEVHAT
jgi:hypothetical protein